MSDAAPRTSNTPRVRRSGSTKPLVLVCALLAFGVALGVALGTAAGLAPPSQAAERASGATSGAETGGGSGGGGGGNAAPAARDDRYETREDRNLSVKSPGVLKNDAGKNLSAHKVSGPRHGRLDLDRDGSFAYRPDKNYKGDDSFSYEARNGKDDRATVRIRVRSVNDGPNARNDGFRVIEDGVLRVGSPGVLRDDSDVDGDRLSAHRVSGPRHGSLNLDRDGSFVYDPGANHAGEDSFVYRATDGEGGADKANASISVIPVNDAPSFTKGPNQTVDEDAGARSVPGWVTNIRKGPANESAQKLTFEVKDNSNPALFSAGPSISPSGALTYKSKANANGQAKIKARLKDNGGTANGGDNASGEKTFSITVNPVNDGPSVSAANDGPINEGQSATITATAVDEEGGALSHEFDCDDDNTFEAGPQAGNTTSCPFYDNGAKTVNVRVSDPDGGQTIGSTTVTVNNVAPTGDFGDGGPVDEGSPATVSFSNQNDASNVDENAGFRYEYRCDGSAFPSAPNYMTASTGATTQCTFSDEGPSTVRARILDKNNGATEYTTDVTVNNVSPNFTAPADQNADEGEDKPFSLGSFTDPGADGPWQVSVDWGDGSADDTFTRNAPGSLGQRTHAYADNGSYTVTVTVAEAGAGAQPSDSDSFSVVISNVAPTVVLSGPGAANEGDTKTYTYTVNDPGDDPNPTITEECGTGAIKDDTAASNSFGCTFPDGDGANGTQYTVSASANDGDPSNNTGLDSILVTASNVAPTADGQSVNTDEDTAKTITLTGDDVAADEPLAFEVTSLSGEGTLYKGNSTAVADEITTTPTTLPGDQVTYKPDPNYFGADFFSFKTSDGTEDSATATVSMQVAPINDAPAVDLNGAASGNDSAAEFLEADGVAVALAPNAELTDVDDTTFESASVALANHPDGNAESLSVDTAGTTITASTYDSGSGILTITGSASKADYRQVLRTVRYDNTATPPDDTDRTVSFTVNDGDTNSTVATATVTVTPVNEPPVVDLNGGVTGTSYDAAFTEDGGAVSIVDSADPDGLTVADADDANIESARIELTNHPDGNAESLSVDTSGTTITASSYNPSTGVLELSGARPVADYQQVLRTVKYENSSNTPDDTDRVVEFTVNDGQDDSEAATSAVSVTAADDSPAAVNDSATKAEDSGATDIPVFANDTDVDGGPKTISSVTQPANGTVAITGGGTGLTYQPNPNYCNDPPGNNPDTFTYTLNGGSTATVSITVTCAEDDPVAVDDSATKAEDSSATDIPVLTNDTDVDGGPKTINSVTQPSNGSVTLTGGSPGAHTGLTYAPNANYCNTPPGNNPDTFTYTLNGGSTATVSVAVTCVDDPPVAVNDSATVLEDAAATSIPVFTNDTDIDAGPKTISSVTQPANGTVAITGGGTGLTYQPNPNYCNDPPASSLDTFTYTLNGGSTATVSMTVTCVNDNPVADNETFNGADSAIGNTALVANDPTDGPPSATGLKKSITGDILTGDTDVDGPNQLSVQAGTFTSNDGGSVTIEADGDFIYVSDPADACADTSDSFDYTITDGNTPTPGTDNGTVTVALTGCVWHVSNNAAGNSGASTAPFDTLAQAESASGTNHSIFVFDGDNTTNGYNAGIDLKANQKLIGEAATLTVGGYTLHTGIPANRPTITDNNNDVVALDDANEVRGLELDPSGTGGGIAGASGDTGGGTMDDVRIIDNGTAGTQPGLELDATTGAFNVSNLTVSTNDGTGVRLNNAGTVNFASAGTVSITAANVSGLQATGTNMGADSVFDSIAVTNSNAGGVSMSNTTGTTTFGDGAGTDLNLNTTSGAAAAFSLSNAGTVTVPGGGTANVSATGGPAVDVTGTSGATLAFDEVDSTGSSTDGVNIAGLGAGTFGANNSSSISNAAGIDFDLDGGSGAITYDGTISDDIGQLVRVNNTTNGTKDFNGNITDGDDGDGSGISLTNNTGATVRFDGGLTLSTGPANAFSATGGGTVAVADPNAVGAAPDNTLTTTTGTALNVANTTIGGSGLNFKSISVNGGANGIVLNNTGTSGGLTVTGSATTANSGGTIQNTTGDAVSLNSTGGHSFNLMRVANPQGDGFEADELTGANSINKSLIEDVNVSNTQALNLENLTANNDSLTLDANTIRDQTNANGSSMVIVRVHGGVNFDFNVVDSNTSDGFDSLFTNLFGSALNMAAGENASTYAGDLDIAVTNTDFTNAAANGLNNLEMTVQGNSGVDYNITDNLFDNVTPIGATVGVINANSLNSGRFGSTGNDTIARNSIQNIGTASGVLTRGYQGIRIALENNVQTITHKVRIQDNILKNMFNRGIVVSSRDQNRGLNLRVQGNTIGTPAEPVGKDNFRALELETQTNARILAEVVNNNIAGAGTSAANSAVEIQTTGLTSDIEATLTGNSIRNTVVAGADGRFRARTSTVSGAATDLCLDVRSNNLEDASKQFQLTNNGSNVLRRNQSGNTGVFSETGTITPTGSCMLPGF